MNVKQYLETIKRDRERMKLLNKRCKSLELDYGLHSVDYSLPKVQSSKGNPLESRVLDLLERTEEMKTDIMTLALGIDNKLSEIEALENPLHVQILFMRYAESKTMQEIADEIGYNYHYVCRIHADALKAFEAMHSKIIA